MKLIRRKLRGLCVAFRVMCERKTELRWRIKSCQKHKTRDSGARIGDMNKKLLRAEVAYLYVAFKKNDKGSVERYNEAVWAHREFYRSLPIEKQREELVQLAVAKLRALGERVSRADLAELRERSSGLPHGLRNPRR